MAAPGYSKIGGSGAGAGGGGGIVNGIDTSIRGGIIGSSLRSSSAAINPPFRPNQVNTNPITPMPFGPFGVMDLSIGAGVALAAQGVNHMVLRKSSTGVADFTASTRTIRPSGSPAGGFQDALGVLVPLAALESFYVTLVPFTGGAIGGWAINMYGTHSSLLMWNANNTNVPVAASTTAYQGCGHAGNFTVTAETTMGITIPYAATARNLCVSLYDTQSATGSLVVTLRKNGAATGLTVTIAAGSTLGVWRDTTNTVSFAAGDWYTWQVVNNASVASANIASISMELAPTTTNHLGLWCPKAILALTASANNYHSIYTSNTSTTTEVDCWCPITRTGDITAFYVYVTSVPTNTVTVTVLINGVASSITGTITAGGGTGSLLLWSGSVAITNLDCITINFAAGSGTQAVVASAALCFEAA